MVLVPWTTLKDRFSGRVEHNFNLGPDPYLNKEVGVFKEECMHLWDMAKLESKVWQLQKPISKCDKKKAEKFKNYSRMVEKFPKKLEKTLLRCGDNTLHTGMDAINRRDGLWPQLTSWL